MNGYLADPEPEDDGEEDIWPDSPGSQPIEEDS